MTKFRAAFSNFVQNLVVEHWQLGCVVPKLGVFWRFKNITVTPSGPINNTRICPCYGRPKHNTWQLQKTRCWVVVKICIQSTWRNFCGSKQSIAS